MLRRTCLKLFRIPEGKYCRFIAAAEISAKSLARKGGISFTCDFNKLNKDADIYIISVTDSALPQIADVLRTGTKLAVHTSGFHSIDIIKSISENIGVFYPLQTFTKNRSR